MWHVASGVMGTSKANRMNTPTNIPSNNNNNVNNNNTRTSLLSHFVGHPWSRSWSQSHCLFCYAWHGCRCLLVWRHFDMYSLDSLHEIVSAPGVDDDVLAAIQATMPQMIEGYTRWQNLEKFAPALREAWASHQRRTPVPHEAVAAGIAVLHGRLLRRHLRLQRDSVGQSTPVVAAPRRWRRGVLDPPPGSYVDMPVEDVDPVDIQMLDVFYHMWQTSLLESSQGLEAATALDIPNWALRLFANGFRWSPARVAALREALERDSIRDPEPAQQEPRDAAETPVSFPAPRRRVYKYGVCERCHARMQPVAHASGASWATPILRCSKWWLKDVQGRRLCWHSRPFRAQWRTLPRALQQRIRTLRADIRWQLSHFQAASNW